MSNNRFSQRAWRIIKEYAGIYGILTHSELQALYTLSAEQFNSILASVSEEDFGEPLLYHEAIGSIHKKWRWAIQGKWSNRWASLYYDTFHPGDVAEMRKIQMRLKMIKITPNTPSCVFMPPIDKTKITEQSSIELIDWELGTQVTREAITDYRRKQIKRNARFRGLVASHPKREAIYTALKLGLKNPTQVCACGCLLSTKPSAQRAHFKTINHCKTILQTININTIERWWRETGEIPPGFTRKAYRWEHIIPADSKRGYRHPIAHKGSIDLVPHIDASLSGVATISRHLPIGLHPGMPNTIH